MKIRTSAAIFLLLAPAALQAAESVLIAGAVTDAAGKPLAGVQIVAATGEQSPASAASDQDGLFWIEAPAGASLRFSREGFLTEEVTASPDDEELTVRLVRAASLVVVIRDKEGKPVAGARVELLDGTVEDPYRSARREGKEPDTFFEETSGKAGEASFPAIPPGLYRVLVSVQIGGGHASNFGRFTGGGGVRGPAGFDL